MDVDRSPLQENGRLDTGRSSFRDGNPHHERHLPPDDHIILQEEDDDSLGGMIVSPRNADHRRQVLVARISPLDVAQLGNVRYHGGVKGYYPLTMAIVHRCRYTALNSTDVILTTMSSLGSTLQSGRRGNILAAISKALNLTKF